MYLFPWTSKIKVTYAAGAADMSISTFPLMEY